MTDATLSEVEAALEELRRRYDGQVRIGHALVTDRRPDASPNWHAVVSGSSEPTLAEATGAVARLIHRYPRVRWPDGGED